MIGEKILGEIGEKAVDEILKALILDTNLDDITYILQYTNTDIPKALMNGYWIIWMSDDESEYFGILKLKSGLILHNIFRNKFGESIEIQNEKSNVFLDTVKIKRIKKIKDNLVISNCTFNGYSGNASLTLAGINEKKGKCYWIGKYLCEDRRKVTKRVFDITLTKANDYSNALSLVDHSMNGCSLNLRSKGIFLSIIVTTYNDEKNIKKCLDSIFNGYVGNEIEVIVVDDGSVDNTSDIVKSYGSCICLIKTIHRGSAYSRNIGMRCAKGKYILFMDGSDELENRIIKHLVDLARKKNVDIICGGCWKKSGQSVPSVKCIPESKFCNKAYSKVEFICKRVELSKMQLGSARGKLYRNKMLKNIHCYFPKGYWGESCFNLAVIKYVNTKIYIDNKLWYIYDATNYNNLIENMQLSEYIEGQYRVLFGFRDVLLSINIDKNERYVQFEDYANLVNNRVYEKTYKEKHLL